jgi:hypothetical protein
MATTVSERKLDRRFDPKTPRPHSAVHARRPFDHMRIWQFIQAIVAELNRQLSGEYERLAELAAVPVGQHDRAVP